ncbi:hypothetical protein HDU98_004050 [Podochytrium sp. JEL0797]|nr:hypothetical protein HDU98_004050 [Podochytrium sp. JEL0797]
MASAWQPDQTALHQLVDALSKTQHPDNAIQQQVQQNAEYANYLCFVFVEASLPVEMRRMAGLLCKTVVASAHNYQRLSQPTLDYVLASVFKEIEDPKFPLLQKTAAIIVTSLVAVDVRHAPTVLRALAAFGAISIVCEDSAQSLDQEASPLLNELIPFFIQKFDHPSAKLRSFAIASTNQFAISHSPALLHHLPLYIQALYRRATDTDKDVIKNVCQGLVLCLEIRPEALQAEMSSLIQFMLKCTESGDSTVALEACEFWLTFAEQENLMDHLEPYLNELIRVLLQGMVYSENDLMNMGPDIEDSHIADRAEDMKPRHAKAKSHASELTDLQKKQLKEQQKAAGQATEDDSDDDYDSEEEEDEDGSNEWTLRKCSAAALDVMSNMYMDAILEPLLPLLKGYLTSPDWKLREAGVLALGAIAEGCCNGIEPHLRDLTKFMLQCLQDVKPLVRSITCWTLSRYSRWIVYGPDLIPQSKEQNHEELYFHPCLQGLLVMVLDNSKRVQEAACSALATLEEEAVEKLNPFLPHILQTLSLAFNKYQHKNLLILYDAVGTLADSVGPALNNAQYIPVLLTPLIEKWKIIHDTDRDIFPLLECLSSVAIALGPGFTEMAPPVWSRCLRIIQTTLEKQVAYNQACAQGAPEAAEDPDMDFVIVSLDLLSGVVQGLGDSAMELVGASQPPIMDVVEFCMKDGLSDIRQSAYALLGDLIISCFPIVRPRLDTLFPLIIHQIGRKDEPYEMSVCNNATWATGELAMQLGAEAKPFLGPLLPVLVGIVNTQPDRRLRTLQENAAITLGRFGLVCPAEMAPAMPVFALGWCAALRDVRDNMEKESAYKGMCLMVQGNPQGMLPHIAFFCDAVMRWERPSVSMHEAFRTTLTGYKTGLGDAQWAQLTNGFPAQTREKMHTRYVAACLPSSLQAILSQHSPTQGVLRFHSLRSLAFPPSPSTALCPSPTTSEDDDPILCTHPDPSHPLFSPLFDPQSPHLRLAQLDVSLFIPIPSLDPEYFAWIVLEIRRFLAWRVYPPSESEEGGGDGISPPTIPSRIQGAVIHLLSKLFHRGTSSIEPQSDSSPPPVPRNPDPTPRSKITTLLFLTEDLEFYVLPSAAKPPKPRLWSKSNHCATESMTPVGIDLALVRSKCGFGMVEMAQHIESGIPVKKVWWESIRVGVHLEDGSVEWMGEGCDACDDGLVVVKVHVRKIWSVESVCVA